MKRWWLLGAAAVIALMLVFVGGLIVASKSAVRNFFYPPAPTMPAVVATSTSDILVQLEIILAAKAPQVLTNLQPGLSADEIARLEKEHGIQLSDDLKALYQWRNGSRQSTNDAIVEFIPGHYFPPLDETLTQRAETLREMKSSSPLQRAVFNLFAGHTIPWIQVFDDGAGDGYFFDPQRKAVEGAVFYHFSEDGTYTFYPSTKNLLASIVQCYEKGAFKTKKEGSDFELEEDFKEAEKIRSEFGVQCIIGE